MKFPRLVYGKSTGKEILRGADGDGRDSWMLPYIFVSISKFNVIFVLIVGNETIVGANVLKCILGVKLPKYTFTLI